MSTIYEIPCVKGFIRMCNDGWLQGWHEKEYIHAFYTAIFYHTHNHPSVCHKKKLQESQIKTSAIP